MNIEPCRSHLRTSLALAAALGLALPAMADQRNTWIGAPMVSIAPAAAHASVSVNSGPAIAGSQSVAVRRPLIAFATPLRDVHIRIASR